MTQIVTLNFCWLKQWYLGIVFLILINTLLPYCAYVHWQDLVEFDGKHPNGNEIISSEESGYNSPEPMKDIRDKNWGGEFLLITLIMLSDVIAWAWINDRLRLIELRFKDCEAQQTFQKVEDK